jgi:hypothetical protein
VGDGTPEPYISVTLLEHLRDQRHASTSLDERERMVVTRSKFLVAEHRLQNQDGLIHVKATRQRAL